jgi:hypothetical protein
MTKHLSAAVCACLVAVSGCGAEMRSGLEEVTVPEGMTPRAGTAGAPAGSLPDRESPATSSAAGVDASKRKIVYRAQVDLVVEEFTPLPERIEAAVKDHGGFISASTVTGSPGTPRSGRWTIRVPVDQFAGFLAAARQLGEVRSIHSTSDDVTAEYYDIEARIRNKQQEEERLLKLLAEATGKLEEILTVERELSRVRGEVEQAQGRMRMLKDVTELTTVTVSVTEIKNYVPEQAPTYGTRVRRAWDSSSAALVRTLQALSLVAVALVPWLPVPLVPLLLILIARRLRRRGV